MSEKLPYMRLWVGDFLGDTNVRKLTTEQRGVYLLVLCLMWENNGWLPASDRIIARMLDLEIRIWKNRYKPFIAPLLDLDLGPQLRPQLSVIKGGIYTQKRLTKEMQKAQQALDNRAAGAATSRAKKAAKSAKRASRPEPKIAQVTKPDDQQLMTNADDQLYNQSHPLQPVKNSTSHNVESSSPAPPSQDTALPPREAARSPEPARDLDAEIGEVRSEITKRLVEDGLKKRPSLSDIARRS